MNDIKKEVLTNQSLIILLLAHDAAGCGFTPLVAMCAVAFVLVVIQRYVECK